MVVGRDDGGNDGADDGGHGGRDDGGDGGGDGQRREKEEVVVGGLGTEVRWVLSGLAQASSFIC